MSDLYEAFDTVFGDDTQPDHDGRQQRAAQWTQPQPSRTQDEIDQALIGADDEEPRHD